MDAERPELRRRPPPTSAVERAAGRRALLEAQAAGPIAIDPLSGSVIVLRHADVERLLTDVRLAGVGLTTFDRMGIDGGPLRDWFGALMFTTEGREHHRLRSLVGKAFSPRAVESLRPAAAAVIAARLAPVRAAGGGDLVEALYDAAMQVMCTLLGVPDADVPAFIAWVDALGPIFGIMTDAQIAAATDAIVALLGYTSELCARREREPAEDLITGLIAAEHDGDRLTRAETASMVANLLVGGHDTTSSQIGCSLFTLLQTPDVLALANAEPELIGAIVSETIRVEPAIGGAPRTVVEPIEIGGAARAPGSSVILNTMTANNDPAVWRAPERFDPRRFAEDDAPKLLTFGGGPHHCLGAWLARLTLAETVRGVAALAPTLAEPAETIPWTTKLGVCPARLPVSVS